MGAFRKIIKRVLEASRRGYWKAIRETIEKLKEEYLKTEEILEEEIVR